jgi:hypothetical protein
VVVWAGTTFINDMHLDFEQQLSQIKLPYTTASGESGSKW